MMAAQGEYFFSSLVVLIGACGERDDLRQRRQPRRADARSAKHKMRMDAIHRAMRSLKVSTRRVEPMIARPRLSPPAHPPCGSSATRRRRIASVRRTAGCATTTLRGTRPLRKRVAIQVHERKLRQVPLFAEVALPRRPRHLPDPGGLSAGGVHPSGGDGVAKCDVDRGRVQVICTDMSSRLEIQSMRKDGGHRPRPRTSSSATTIGDPAISLPAIPCLSHPTPPPLSRSASSSASAHVQRARDDPRRRLPPLAPVVRER